MSCHLHVKPRCMNWEKAHNTNKSTPESSHGSVRRIVTPPQLPVTCICYGMEANQLIIAMARPHCIFCQFQDFFLFHGIFVLNSFFIIRFVTYNFFLILCISTRHIIRKKIHDQTNSLDIKSEAFIMLNWRDNQQHHNTY